MQEQISIPEEDAEFLRTYARQYGISVQKLIHEWVKQLKDPNDASVHPSLKTMTGTVPDDVDIREEYYAHQIEKHS